MGTRSRFVVAALSVGAVGTACGGALPIPEVVSPGKILILLAVLLVVVAIGLFAARRP